MKPLTSVAVEQVPPSPITPTIPTVVIEPRKGLFSLNLLELWHSRELLYFLVWRDVKVRYKQTVIGAAWVVLQPFLNMMIFSVIFGYLARIPSEGVPYPIFAFTALLPWYYFSNAVIRASNSLVGDSDLIMKVYFPRLILPISAVTSPILDFGISVLVLAAMMIWYGIVPTVAVLTLPLFLALAFITALAMGFWLSALNVRYRDVTYTIPFLLQVWMYVSPVVYSADMIPQRFHLLYNLNPLVGVVEGFRWGLLGANPPDPFFLAVNAGSVAVLFLSGMIFFGRMEATFADIV
ncbi:MAG: ABC transporter permease [Acidimicrobiia bacterium]